MLSWAAFRGNGLSELFGIISEEIDTLYPSDRNHIRFGNGWEDWEVRDYAEILRLTDAEVLGRYTDDFYQAARRLPGNGTERETPIMWPPDAALGRCARCLNKC